MCMFNGINKHLTRPIVEYECSPGLLVASTGTAKKMDKAQVMSHTFYGEMWTDFIPLT